MKDDQRIFVKPAQPALKVRKPVGTYLAPEGELQNDDSYWRRRVSDGDVVVSKPPKTAPAAPAAPPASDAAKK